ncbi:MAG: hypothetical protein Q8O55_06900 [Dehalococcoidales bacterium]|nr:hypothetical protein [Dehalococcoidales bacterium]
MNQKSFITLFTAVGVIGALFGSAYAFFGLGILPVSGDVLISWGNGVYGSTLIGFSILILFTGRHAFKQGDTKLMKALLYGTWAWLIIEASFSLFYGVFFNFGVDILLMALFGYPLIRGIRNR